MVGRFLIIIILLILKFVQFMYVLCSENEDYMILYMFILTRSSITAADYDVPRSRLSTSVGMSSHQSISGTKVLTFSQNNQQLYDIPVNKVLPLELDLALENLQKLQNEASAAITKLLSFVCPGWRTSQKLEKTLMDLKLASLRLRTSLHDLTEFAEGL